MASVWGVLNEPQLGLKTEKRQIAGCTTISALGTRNPNMQAAAFLVMSEENWL